MNDLLFTQGQDNLAGLVDQIYYCPTEDINTVPALTLASSLKTAAQAITCKSGKKFNKVYFTDESAKLASKSVGPRDGKGRETMLTIKYPKLTTELADFISDIQNTPVVIIFRMMDGKLRLLGVNRLDKTSTVLSLSPPAYFEQADSDSGEKRADEHGCVIGWKFTTSHDPIEYAGTIPLVAAP